MFNLAQVKAMRLMAGLAVLLLAVGVVLMLPRLAQAGTSSQVINGELTINLSGDDDVAVACVNGQVKLNGVDPQSGPLACNEVTAIVVNGGNGANAVRLNEIRPADFPQLAQVMIDAAAGDDQIYASELAETLNGGTGNDVFVGTQPIDRVDGGAGETWFVEATTPSHEPSIQTQLGPLQADNVAYRLPPSAPGLGTTIEAVNFVTDATNGGFYHIPPDPIGAAGPNHVVNVVNTSIQWYTKAGVQERNQRLGRNGSTHVGSFFESLTPVNGTFDPKVIYDQYAGRFLVVTLEVSGTVDNNPNNVSRILLAVSDDNDPNGIWYYHAINSRINIGGLDRWADYPGFAVDDKAVYITSNMFSFGAGAFGGSRLWIINKTPFYTNGAATVNIYDPPTAVSQSATTMQPAHMFGVAPSNVGTWLVRYSGYSDGTNESLSIIRVDDPLGTPVFTHQFVSIGDIDNTSIAFPGVPQTVATTRTLDGGDRRALHAVWRDNALWTTVSLMPASGGDVGQVTAHWAKVDTTNLTGLSIADQGNVSGNDIAASTHTFYPSIAVDPCGNMAIGFAASAPTIFPGAYYTGRLATDAAGTVQSSGALAAGLDWYYRVFNGTRNRWGDYSGISLDPSAEATFWVFNEYAMIRGTPTGSPSQDGRWATRWGSFVFNTGGFDFGDLPSSYNLINRSNDGARHCFNASGLRLGATIDAESDGQASANSSGDGTDEDGITYTSTPWSDGANGGTITTTVSGGSGVLNGWIDWNNNSNFTDPGDKIITNTAVSAGSSLISFFVPSGTFPGSGANRILNARFRLTSVAPVSATAFYAGTAPDGEVEDYQWNFTPTAVTFQQAQAQPTNASPAWLILLLLAGGATIVIYRLRRKHSRT
jgi:GEVED domain